MEKEKNILLEGEKLVLHKMDQPELKGVYTKAIFGFDFYTTQYKGCEFGLLEPNEKDSCKYTLTQFSNISKSVSDIFGKPVAFLFDHRIYHDENIMPNNRGVYFILSNEYAFLPFLSTNESTAQDPE